MPANNELETCKEGIESWTSAFNNKDTVVCAAQYTEDSVMEARPFGTFNGREEIQTFR